MTNMLSLFLISNEYAGCDEGIGSLPYPLMPLDFVDRNEGEGSLPYIRK